MTREARGAFITGAGVGLGREMALAFAAEGYSVAVTGIEGVDETVRKIRRRGGVAWGYPLDVTSPGLVQEAVAGALDTLKSVDVLVNNAAIEGPTAPLNEVEPAEWERTLNVNLTGAFLCDRAIIPHMMARRSGIILHIASVAGLQAYPLRSPYAVSKWGIIGLTQTLAAELGAFNVRVNAVCPGPVEGDRMQRVIAHRASVEGREIAEIEEDYKKRTVLHRMVGPQEVIRLVLFLASESARDITGQAIRICAGYGL